MTNVLRPTTDLNIHPQMARVLDGGFFPPYDPTNEHTLLGLMMGVIEQGQELQSPRGHQLSEDMKAYGYEPDWAHGTHAIVRCRVRHDKEIVVGSLALEYAPSSSDENRIDMDHSSHGSVSIVSRQNGPSHRNPAQCTMEVSGSQTGANTHQLAIARWVSGVVVPAEILAFESGPRLMAARKRVTVLAQEFFDRQKLEDN